MKITLFCESPPQWPAGGKSLPRGKNSPTIALRQKLPQTCLLPVASHQAQSCLKLTSQNAFLRGEFRGDAEVKIALWQF